MRRFRWLPWLSSSAVVAGTSLLLSPSLVKAEALDEAKVKGVLMQRFDENRNDKLDSGEARQARARLKNLLEDKSEREINIQTWRDDVRELLQTLDTDTDSRLSIAERDAGRELLDRLIPAVDATAPKERETPSTSVPKKEKDNDGERSRRAGLNSRGRSNSSAMGGGGFGMSASGNINGYSSNNYNSRLNGMNSNWSSGSSSSTSGGGSSGFSGASGSGVLGSMVNSTNPQNPTKTSEGSAMSSEPLGDTSPSSGSMAQPTMETSSSSKGMPTSGKTSGIQSGNSLPPKPDDLGGGMGSPLGGGPLGGKDGTSTVPFDPKPDF